MSHAKSADFTKRLDELYEFDREPVPANKLCNARHFAGLYAGEHTAATEFVIGALFVTWGASVFDMVVGLLIGNLLAVLSWTLVCAPIATSTRLTLFWYLHRIGGPVLATIYNVCNAVLFCILAGTMITVSASAVRLVFDIPAQTAWYPTDFRFVLIVLIVGAVIMVLAILGFKRLAQFASVCAPWMIVMFVAGALVALPVLGKISGVGPITRLSKFWEMAETVVWTGSAVHAENQIGFWHVMAFAWICNLAMHIGLSDMSAFRYAKKASYGLCTWTGMFLGHYLAWICAGLLGAGAAMLLKTPLAELDSGAVGYAVLGASGAIAVVLAGWTTANPTLYKAGLAIQAVTPDWPRWKVTLVVGTITTIIACFPFVFTKMLSFIGLYGLLLMPIGAIVFTEYWIFPKIGLQQYWVSHQNRLLNWPALLAWMIAITVATILWYTDVLHLFFLFIPVWFLSTGLYIVLAAIGGAKEGVSQESVTPGPPIEVATEDRLAGTVENKIYSRKTLCGAVALAALIICLWMPLQVCLAGIDDYDANLAFFKKWLILPSALYFLAATIRQKDIDTARKS
jgi:cytosine permease